MPDRASDADRDAPVTAAAVRVLYLASMREQMGRSEERLALPRSVATVDALAALIADRGVREQAAFGDRRAVRAAVNRRFARPQDPVHAGDEVAFFPPVTGG